MCGVECECRAAHRLSARLFERVRSFGWLNQQHRRRAGGVHDRGGAECEHNARGPDKHID